MGLGELPFREGGSYEAAVVATRKEPLKAPWVEQQPEMLTAWYVFCVCRNPAGRPGTGLCAAALKEGAEGRLAPRVPPELEVGGTQKHKINQAGPFHCRSDSGMETLQVCSLVTVTATRLYSNKQRILLLIFWPCWAVNLSLEEKTAASALLSLLFWQLMKYSMNVSWMKHPQFTFAIWKLLTDTALNESYGICRDTVDLEWCYLADSSPVYAVLKYTRVCVTIIIPVTYCSCTTPTLNIQVKNIILVTNKTPLCHRCSTWHPGLDYFKVRFVHLALPFHHIKIHTIQSKKLISLTLFWEDTIYFRYSPAVQHL